MTQGRTDRDWAVVAVMTFLAGALLMWALLGRHPPQPRPPEDVDWPAWVQAVGSLVAIAVAIAIPLRVARYDRQQRALDSAARARTYALHLMPLADRLLSKLRNAQILMMDPDEEDIDQVVEIVREATALDGWGFHLHELGKAGDFVQRALAAATSTLESLGDLQYFLSFNNTIVDDETGEMASIVPPAPIGPQLDRAVSLASQARDSLRELFD